MIILDDIHISINSIMYILEHMIVYQWHSRIRLIDHALDCNCIHAKVVPMANGDKQDWN